MIGKKIDIKELDKLVDYLIDSHSEENIKDWLFAELGAPYIIEYCTTGQQGAIYTLEMVTFNTEEFDSTELSYYAENQAS